MDNAPADILTLIISETSSLYDLLALAWTSRRLHTAALAYWRRIKHDVAALRPYYTPDDGLWTSDLACPLNLYIFRLMVDDAERSTEIQSECCTSANREYWCRFEETPDLLSCLLHRASDLPAIVSPTSQEWYIYGIRHRANGPAILRADGTGEWWKYGKFIRKGPA
jgi:hypothetical protein